VRVLSIGDLLLDVLVRYDPLSGEADTGQEGVQIWPGGSAANFAVQAARLGAEVRFVSRVGRDWAGDMLVRSLESEGVAASVKLIDEEPSGRVLVMVDPTGHRRMWSYPGASRTLSADDLEPSWFEGLDVFHLTGYSLLREGPRAAALAALKLARDLGSPFCTLDPNPPHLIVDYGPQRFREMLAELRFDVIFPNRDEGRLLTACDAPADIATGLLDVSRVVALTLGADGCLVATHDGPLAVQAAPVDAVVDATGAGDAFAAAFVVEYLRTQDVDAAAQAANRCAADVVGRVGGR
jgi:sugar/nucleoside kinase (ribokinase family)